MNGHVPNFNSDIFADIFENMGGFPFMSGFGNFGNRRKPKIKKIDLAQGDFEKTVAGLTSSDKAMIKDLLRKSGIKVSD